MRRSAVAATMLGVLLAGCGRLDLPRIGLSPGPPGDLENRVWVRDDGAEGAIRVFLSDGGLLSASCAGGYEVTPWRRVDDTTLAWETDAGVVRAEIAVIGPRELALVVDPDAGGANETYRLAQAPLRCGDAPG